jgi:hypothetical protein
MAFINLNKFELNKLKNTTTEKTDTDNFAALTGAAAPPQWEGRNASMSTTTPLEGCG